jgi:hypothetical protein
MSTVITLVTALRTEIANTEAKLANNAYWIARGELTTKLRDLKRSLEIAELKQDIITLTLRLLLEDPTSHSPETAAVMSKWLPAAQAVRAEAGEAGE